MSLISNFPVETQNIIREFLVGDNCENVKEYKVMYKNPHKIKEWIKNCNRLLNKYYINIYKCDVKIEPDEDFNIYLILTIWYRMRWYVPTFGQNKIYLMNEIFLDLKNYSLDINKIIKRIKRHKL